MHHILRAEDIEVISQVDTAVVGGSFAGIACAVEIAKSGKKVIVIEPRTYLGWELNAVLRPWLELQPDSSFESLPEIIRVCLEAQGDHVTDRTSYIPLHPDRLKRSLEDILLSHGIALLYASLPIGLCESQGQVSGVVIANKSGRQVIRCDKLIDATETALTAALSGERASNYMLGPTAKYFRVLEFTQVAELEESVMLVPEHLKLAGSRLRFRQGYLGQGHVFVEFGLELESSNSMEASRNREIEVRHRSMALAVYLVNKVASFGKGVLGAASHELLGPFPIDSEHAPQPESFILINNTMTINLAGVWCLFKHLYQQGSTSLLDPVQASKIGERIARAVLLPREFPTVIEQNVVEALIVPASCSETRNMEIASPRFIAKAEHKPTMHVADIEIHVFKQVDVLVAGGGSSGASAAITSGLEGMNTLLVDLNPGLGGTGTFGGVDSYWFGRRVGFAELINNAVLVVQHDLRYKGHKWNIEAKMYALLQEAAHAAVDLLFNVITFGAVKKGSQVCGIVIATRWGPFSIQSQTVIDATGDGDVAAFAGAEYVYGSLKDNTVMWYSLAQYQTPAKIQNNFTSMVDVSNVLDYTRAIMAGRRRGTDCHDHGIYIATRESRHIIGDVVMQLSDQLLHRKWPDVVNIHFSNHDVKGVSGADWVNIGLIPPNLEIEIPYRMLLPKGLEGILVAGKAVSATHDALPAIRMQSDLENLGAVAALAASLAVSSKTSLRAIDLKKLQLRLIRENLLSDTTLTRRLASTEYSHADLEKLAASIEAEQPLYDYSNMRMNEIYQANIPFVEICSAGPRIIPHLEQALASAEGMKKMRIAQALCMLGSQSGVPVLIDEIMSALNGQELPRRTADIMYVQLPPDHGAMPDTANYLYSLAQAKDRRSIPILQRVADLLQPDEADFKDTWKGIFYYVDAICQGAERLGDRAAVTLLQQIHQISLFRDQVCLQGFQADYFRERRAMLELGIGKALARCGSESGYEILIAYLADSRSLLAKSALQELQRISGKTSNNSQNQWNTWLQAEKPYLQTFPLDIQLDIEVNSESILRG